jgi:hypothetical protein
MKRYIGKRMWEGYQRFHALSGSTTLPYVNVLATQKLSKLHLLEVFNRGLIMQA